MDRVYSTLLQIPGVDTVNATRSKGEVKHYNVRIKVSNRQAIPELEQFWPYGVISVNRDGMYADYIVRPNEVELFQRKLKKIEFRSNKEVAIIFHLNYSASDKLKSKLSASVRASDRLVWSDNKVAIVLQDCNKQVIDAVKKRVENLLLSEAYAYDVSIHTNNAVS